ncbi:MAG: hypothetical protein K8U57_09095 [Planctomycetes bacterium]|nr:hypothetical protein [Planctomycetota bacterium]
MGLDRTIRFPTAETPAWEAIRAQLVRVGETGQLRMIDGLPAFPDEDPAENWKELRVGTAAGMVTIRRGAGVLMCVVWGNADPAMNAAWAKVIWACATAGTGVIDTPAGPTAAEQFAQSEGISPT